MKKRVHLLELYREVSIFPEKVLGRKSFKILFVAYYKYFLLFTCNLICIIVKLQNDL